MFEILELISALLSAAFSSSSLIEPSCDSSEDFCSSKEPIASFVEDIVASFSWIIDF